MHVESDRWSKGRRSALVLAACATIGLTTGTAFSATWTGAVDSDWGNAGNWDAAVPGVQTTTAGNLDGATTTDIATFDSSDSSQLQVNPDANRTVRQIVFGSNAGNYIIGDPNIASSLQLTDQSVVGIQGNNSSSITFNSDIYAEFDLTYGGGSDSDKGRNLTVSLGDGQTMTFNGKIYLADSRALYFGGVGGTAIINTEVTYNPNQSGIRPPGSMQSDKGAHVVMNHAQNGVGFTVRSNVNGRGDLEVAGAVTNAKVYAAGGGSIYANVENALSGSASIGINDSGDSGTQGPAYIYLGFANDNSGGTTLGKTSDLNLKAGHSVLEIANATGSATGSGDVNLISGTLQGSGRIANSGAGRGVTISERSILAPGNTGKNSDATIGTLTLDLGDKGLDLSAIAGANVGSLQFDLDTPANSDLVNLTAGALNIGSGLNFADFEFNALSGFDAGTYTLFQTTTSIIGSLGTATGMVGGLDATLGFAGNDLVLTVVPEPGTFGLLAVSGLALLRRRRRA